MKTNAFSYIRKYSDSLLGVLSGISVFYFLFFLDAFNIQKGISSSGHSHLVRSACFGTLTFSYQFILEVLIKKKFNLSSLRSYFIWYLSLVVIGSQLIFVLFNFFWNWQEWDLMGYFLIQIEYPLMMIFPLSTYLLLRFIISKNTNYETHLIFCSENKKDHLKIKIQDFLFAKAEENYVAIFYKIQHEQKQHLIRKPLKNIESELSIHPQIKRNHRSYLVNTSNIDNIVQKKDKYFAEIVSYSLPISKKYKDLFLS